MEARAEYRRKLRIYKEKLERYEARKARAAKRKAVVSIVNKAKVESAESKEAPAKPILEALEKERQRQEVKIIGLCNESRDNDDRIKSQEATERQSAVDIGNNLVFGTSTNKDADDELNQRDAAVQWTDLDSPIGNDAFFGNHALKSRLPEVTNVGASNKVTFNLDPQRDGSTGQNDELLADNSYDSIYDKVS